MYRYIYLYIIIYIYIYYRARVRAYACVGARAYVRVDVLTLLVLPYFASHTKLAYILKDVDEFNGDFDTFLYFFGQCLVAIAMT